MPEGLRQMDRAGTVVVTLLRPTEATTAEELRENSRVELELRTALREMALVLLPEGWKADIDGKVVAK